MGTQLAHMAAAQCCICNCIPNAHGAIPFRFAELSIRKAASTPGQTQTARVDSANANMLLTNVSIQPHTLAFLPQLCETAAVEGRQTWPPRRRLRGAPDGDEHRRAADDGGRRRTDNRGARNFTKHRLEITIAMKTDERPAMQDGSPVTFEVRRLDTESLFDFLSPKSLVHCQTQHTATTTQSLFKAYQDCCWIPHLQRCKLCACDTRPTVAIDVAAASADSAADGGANLNQAGTVGFGPGLPT